MDFRAKLLGTLRAIQPVLDVPGVMIIGSEVPNLLEPNGRSTLVVSRDVDIGVPVARHGDVKGRLHELRAFEPSKDEPSVWVPKTDALLEVNFLGMDAEVIDAAETYVFEDETLPLLVFGPLSFMRAGPTLHIEGICIPLPHPTGFLVEKLLTDRTGEKGDRDLLVVAGLMTTIEPAALAEFEAVYMALGKELRHVVRSNLTILSLMSPHAGMPDPRPLRAPVAALLLRLEAVEARVP